MCVRGDDHLHAALLAHPQIHILQVKTVRVGVAFHGHTVFGAGVQHLLHVVVERIAPQQQTPCGVRDDLCVRVFDGRKKALCHRRTVQIEVRVHGANDDIKLRQDFVRIIQLSIFEDVDFRACKHPDPQLFLA